MEEYSVEKLKEIFEKHWRVGYGSIAADEVLFVQDLIQKYRPVDFLEVGMASGLSGGVICQLLEWNSARTFTSIDHDDTFFADKTKENGFLINQIYTGNAVEVQKHFFVTTPKLAQFEKKFQMSFVDANHQHPWPLIDTLCIFPYLSGDKVLIHHDLHLYQKQPVVRGIGPKYLFDQFPERNRITSDANHGNIYALKLDDLTSADIEEVAIRCFYLPWSIMSPLAPALVEVLDGIFSEFYSQRLVDAFHTALDRFNERK